MRLSTAPDRDDETSVAVIRAALDSGATLLDSALAYALDDGDSGHNERLIARALAGWKGDRSSVTVATKGGMRRPRGAWVPDGRAKTLREQCDASRAALGVDTIDLYQLHVVDPRTPIETSVRALARLKEEGKIREIGLCNVNVAQIRAARAMASISCVQVSISPFDDENVRNGVAEYCRDEGITCIAHRPLGGDKSSRLNRNALVKRIASARGCTEHEIILAWLVSLGLVPIPGATRIENARSLAKVLSLELSVDEKEQIDVVFRGRLLRVPRARRMPRSSAGAEVVVIMGMPGAGKSHVARKLERDGFQRLNRDEIGGSLSELAERMKLLLAAGTERIVLDNTYPTRKSRNEVIETAWEAGAHVRCIWLRTSMGDAQVNAIIRMIDANGSLPDPATIRERGRKDTRYLLPDALFRYERTLEPPSLDEGFTAIDEQDFVRDASGGKRRAIIVDADSMDDTLRAEVRRRASEGWLVFGHAWRPAVSKGDISQENATEEVRALLGALDGLAGVELCPHEAGPPVCWCRKPIPGLLLDFALRHDVSLARSIVAGSSPLDRTMAERVGATFLPAGRRGESRE